MKTITGFLMARLPSVLLFIIALCICSVLVSVYYLHTDVLPSHIDVLRANGYIKVTGRVIGDNTLYDEVRQHTWHPSERHRNNFTHLPNTNGIDTDLKALNDIDIAFHIENKKSRQQNQQQQHGKRKKGGTQNLKLGKKDMWPSHEKVHKEKKPIVPLAMQIYNNPQRSRADWTGERFIVYLCHSNVTCAGWGDRQHGIFSAYLISLVTNRTFKADMQSPCPLFKLYHPRHLNWKVNGTELHGLSSTHLYALNDRKFRDSMKMINFNEMYPHDVVYLTTNYDYFYNLKSNPHYKSFFKQKVRGRPRPILFAELWQTIFKMNKRVVKRFSPALKQAWPTQKHKLVCAHVRFGRNPTIPTDSYVRNTLSTIKPLWKFLDRYSDPRKYRLFVASDWEGFRDKVISMYPSITINVEGRVIHIDKMKGPQSHNNISHHYDMCTGFEKVIADQYLLSRCDILLLTYSVFGKAAAYLRRSNTDLFLMENGTIKTLKLFDENYTGL